MRTLVAEVDEKDYLQWHVEHPNGSYYDVIFHKDDKTWSVDWVRWSDHKGRWVSSTLCERRDKAPDSLLHECGVERLVA